MKPRAVLLTIVPLALLLLPLGVFFVDHALAAGRVPRNVSVGGVPLGGLDRADALLAVRAEEARLLAEPARFLLDGKPFSLSGADVGFHVDAEAAVDAALHRRDASGLPGSFAAWIDGFRDPIDLDLPVEVDEARLDAVLDRWEGEAIPDRADPGTVRIVDGEVVPVYPKAGRAVDRDAARRLVVESLATLGEPPAALPVVVREPKVARADIDAAAEQVRRMIDGPVTLRSEETNFLVTFTPDELRDAIRVTVTDDPPEVSVHLDPTSIAAILEPRRAEFETPAVNAAYAVDMETDTVTVVPSRNATVMDLPGVVAALEEAALGSGFGPFPLAAGAPPEFTTADAESYGPLTLVSEFTTKYPPGQPRVINIHRMADEVDGAVVFPGETFSINSWVGRRTEKDGYVAAPAIIHGVPYCCDNPANIGGGVSQFGTTFFNAVFFGCYEDVEHQPHSLYFSRYPVGREATLGYPKPDVIFRNNTEAPVIIKTAYTNRTITVKFYGNNGGRTCTAETSEKENVVEPGVELVPDEEGILAPGEQEEVWAGKKGFTIHVTRVIEEPDGTIVREEPFTWRYNKLDERIKVHPCEVTGEPVDCPIQLPDLVGTPYADAYGQLVGSGFVVVRIDEEVTDPAAEGTVLAMDPVAGTWVDPGGSVKLTVGVAPAG